MFEKYVNQMLFKSVRGEKSNKITSPDSLRGELL